MTKQTNLVFKKIIDYAHKTGITFRQTPRRNLCKALGLPDIRGFSPHLRAVNLALGQKLLDPWVIHDVLHIMFYDYVFVHLGRKGWSDRVRFFENHLASEAFALLVLDYHLLSFEKRGGLAADVSATKWKQFQKLNPGLPHFLSPEFCEILTNLYLSGNEEPFAIESLDSPIVKPYGHWLGHEVRYSEKQRYYVGMWWNDLNQKLQDKKSFALGQSGVHFVIWEMLELLLYKPHIEWKSWINKVNQKCGKTKNSFSNFPKFKTCKKIDFRFSNFEAFSIDKIEKELRAASKPNPSSLFLFWQIISTLPVINRNHIRALAKSAQTPVINTIAWTKVQQACLNAVIKNGQWKTEPNTIGNFYLP